MAGTSMFVLFNLSFIAMAMAFNITEILNKFPEYSQFNSYLTETKLADEINSRHTITVLVVKNAAMSSAFPHGTSAEQIKPYLSLHVLLDYFDSQKLHKISNGSVLVTTLYQTTGRATNNEGFVNITDLRGGKVQFRSGLQGSKPDSSFVKSVKQMPYNISVVEISAPIAVSGLASAAPSPSPTSANLTDLLSRAGCTKFANMIKEKGVMKSYKDAVPTGLTIFAPSDEAFNASNTPNLSKLPRGNTDMILRYHAAAAYLPLGTLKNRKEIATLAGRNGSKLVLTVAPSSDSVTLKTGVGSAKIVETVFDSSSLVIFKVDHILVPRALAAKSPATAPTATPTPAPTPVASRMPSPSPGPSQIPPSPLPGVSPAPSPLSPGGRPADSSAGTDLLKPLPGLAAAVMVTTIFSVIFA